MDYINLFISLILLAWVIALLVLLLTKDDIAKPSSFEASDFTRKLKCINYPVLVYLLLHVAISPTGSVEAGLITVLICTTIVIILLNSASFEYHKIFGDYHAVYSKFIFTFILVQGMGFAALAYHYAMIVYGVLQ